MLQRRHSTPTLSEPIAVRPTEQPTPDGRGLERGATFAGARRHDHLHWDWDAYRHFVVLARSGVMRRAAETLGVSVPTLSRRIEQLERSLGLCLFLRRPSGLELTMAGRQLLENCEQVSEAFGLLELSMNGRGAAVDQVNLSIDSMLVQLLLPALLPFLAANAGIIVSLTTFCAHRPESGDSDLSFGFTRPDRGRRKIRRLAHMPMSMAAPSGFDEGGRSALPVWSFRDGVWFGRQVSSTGAAELRITNPEDVAALVRSGFGVAILPDYMIVSDRGLARFNAAGGESNGTTLPVWMSLQESASRSAAARAVATICSEVIQARLSTGCNGDGASISADDGPREPIEDDANE